MKGAKRKVPIRVVTQQERAAYGQELEERYPGYLEENIKLITIVKCLTGVRVLYGLYYLLISYLYGLQLGQSIFTIFGAFVFYAWYTWMLRAGKGVAILMLLLRGFSIVSGGVSILGMSYWLPFPLIFTLTAACIMEFCEAIFCIYILFNKNAATVVRMNKEAEAHLTRGVSHTTLGKMAEYQNPCTEEEEDNGREKNSTEEKDV